MKPSLPKGTRDFLPESTIRRQYLFDIISNVFRRYGYVPIETPALENLSTLLGKYGEEGDRLVFKVLNNGDYLAQADTDALDARNSQALVPSIAKRGMRYDLTVPFARFVVMHQNDLTFPFKRYQIQPVWRADRPQKGRYQEFYQCDADVVGSTSLLYEAELLQIYDDVFAALKLPVRIRINSRKILTAIAEVAGIPGQVTDMTVAVDKWDKIGEDGVRQELSKRDIPLSAIDSMIQALGVTTLEELSLQLQKNVSGKEGIAEVQQVLSYISTVKTTNKVEFDAKLARGLDYYTGCIVEVEAVDAEMGSLGGGGRYDDLTGVFGLKGTSGVGISFGAERIFDVMETQDLFPADLRSAPEVLFIALDENSLRYAFQVAKSIRDAGVYTDIYPEIAKMQKQMRYANQLGVPYVAIIGEQEVAGKSVMLKDMQSGDQKQIAVSDLVEILSKRG
jgi:histidyl-tRNA synthetase